MNQFKRLRKGELKSIEWINSVVREKGEKKEMEGERQYMQGMNSLGKEQKFFVHVIEL